ncbi:MAG: hypothetical protein ACYTXT_22200 [Nostoc sp.]
MTPGKSTALIFIANHLYKIATDYSSVKWSAIAIVGLSVQSTN